GPGPPDWYRTKLLYIRWHAAEGTAEFTFSIRPIEVGSLPGMRRGTRELAQRLSDWHKNPHVPDVSLTDIGSLPLPPVAAVTSTSLSALRNPRQILNMFIFTALLSGCVAALLKLPIEWIAPNYLAQDTGGYAEISGWYAILISLVMMVIRFGPVWFFRPPGSP